MLAEQVCLFEQWLDTKVGQKVLDAQQGLIDTYVKTCFGYHLMQLSMSRQVDLFGQSRVRHCFALGAQAGGNIRALCHEDLPLPAESIDVAILHHVLEYSDNPHKVLRETVQALMPEGRLIIVGFNPYSAMGLKCLAGRLSKQTLWQSRVLSVRRLSDWLALMDCKLCSVKYGFYHWPFDFLYAIKIPYLAEVLQDKQWPLGSVYVLMAEKKVSRLTPIPWQKRKAKTGLSLAKDNLTIQDTVNKHNER